MKKYHRHDVEPVKTYYSIAELSKELNVTYMALHQLSSDYFKGTVLFKAKDAQKIRRMFAIKHKYGCTNIGALALIAYADNIKKQMKKAGIEFNSQI